MSVIDHRGFSSRIQFDAEDKIFFGNIAGISDVVGFHGESVDELKQAFQSAVDDYIETCRKLAHQPRGSVSPRPPA